MKITVMLLILLVLFRSNAVAEDYTRWNLPEGAIVRLGKGSVMTVLYSPDGAAACCSQFHRYLAL